MMEDLGGNEFPPLVQRNTVNYGVHSQSDWINPKPATVSKNSNENFEKSLSKTKRSFNKHDQEIDLAKTA